MVYRPSVDSKLCFVLMPFGHPFDSYYVEIIKPAALDCGLATIRSDEIYSTKSIIKDIWTRLWKARVVIADASGRNANVNYELGLCHALGIPTVIITSDIEDVPFDYKHRRCIVYKCEEPDWAEKLRTNLSNTIETVLADATNENDLEWPYDTNILKEPPSAGLLIAHADSRKIVIRGANLVRAAIASAFGPYGASVAISQPFGYDRQLKRGSQIAQGIKSSNPLEEKGIDQIRSTTFAVQGLAGDFSKLAAILAAGLMSRGQELIEKGLHPQDILRGLEHAVDRVCNHLDDSAKPTSHSDLVGVATAAASGNDRVGVLVAEAVNRAGAHGVITIETADQRDTVLEIEEGLRFDRGYLSDYFVTDAESMSCVLENCLVLCYQKRIQMMKELLPLLEQVARSQQALLIIAEDIEGEALATLTVNKIKGTLRCVAVKAPGEGERRKAILEDIAILTGGMFVSHELGRPLTDVGIANLGTASRVVVTKDVTTITGGLGAQGAIAERIRSIQTQISCAISPYDREKLQERLARLAGSVVVLKAGGVSEGDLLQEKYRSESALNSAVSAMTHGTVIGGGVALLRAGMALRKAQTNNEVDAQTMEALAAVLEEPIRQLIENAQRSPTQVLSEITKSASECLGFNSSNGKVEDLGAASVLDPANSVKQALRMAASHAGSVLQTGTWDLSPPLNPIQTPGQAHIES